MGNSSTSCAVDYRPAVTFASYGSRTLCIGMKATLNEIRIYGLPRSIHNDGRRWNDLVSTHCTISMYPGALFDPTGEHVKIVCDLIKTIPAHRVCPSHQRSDIVF